MNTPKTEKTRGAGISSEAQSGSGMAAGSPMDMGSSSTTETGTPRYKEAGSGRPERTGSAGAAGSVASEVSKTAQTTARAVKDHASELASQVGRDISAMAEDQKTRGVEVVRTFARAMDNAASELEKESPMVASYVREAANQVEHLSERLRERSASDLMSAANDMARSQPLLFFGGAVAAGFVLARFLKSSGRYRSYSGASTYPDYYGEGEPMHGEMGGYRGSAGAGAYGGGSSMAGQSADRGSTSGSPGTGSGSTAMGTGSTGMGAGSTGAGTGSAGMSSGSNDSEHREGRHGRT